MIKRLSAESLFCHIIVINTILLVQLIMDELNYKKSVDCLIYLCTCSINNVDVEASKLEHIDLNNLYQVSCKHMLASMVGQILCDFGISTSNFESVIALAQRKAIVLDNEYKLLSTYLESSEIWYMPLKGIILKDLYPRFAMREMADYDILFDFSRAGDVKDIMKNLGFQVKSFGEKNDDDYIKPPVSNFEMHRSLFGNAHDKRFVDYYCDLKTRLVKDDNYDFRYHFTPEDFYIFMIAHEYKHYSSSGTGLRSLIDTYIYLKNYSLDLNYVKNETRKLGISEYEEDNRTLSQKVFTGQQLNEKERVMFDYIVSAGVYGTFSNSVENKLKKEGRKKYFTRRFFGPYKKDDPYRIAFRKKYSTFYKYPVLLPFLPFYRLFKAIKNNPKRIKSEINTLKSQKE